MNKKKIVIICKFVKKSAKNKKTVRMRRGPTICFLVFQNPVAFSAGQVEF